MTKIGCKKQSRVKVKSLKRSKINPVSKKQSQENMELKALKGRLMVICHNRSELSGEAPDWQSNYMVEMHHLGGRGKNLLNVFQVIMLTRNEHLVEQKHMSYEHKQELIAKIKPIRLAQGFREADYQ